MTSCSAKDVVFRAIKAGKHVVTANKALIAAYLSEIQALLAENPSARSLPTHTSMASL